MANTVAHSAGEDVRSGHWYRAGGDDSEPQRPRSLQSLHNEHIYMAKLLDTLDEQVGLITQGKDADFKLLLDIVDYLQNFPEQYHHPKEDLIYQRMALRDESFASELFALLEEHQALAVAIERLAEAIRDVHIMPTMLKKERVGELCAQYELRMREHINTEESRILPKALELLREEDWFIVDQQSTPMAEIPVANLLTDHYSSLRRRLLGSGEKWANNVVLAEFLANHSLLEVAGGLGAGLSYGRDAYSSGMQEGWHAYLGALKSWLPVAWADSDVESRQNPLRACWSAYVQGVKKVERPQDELLQPLLRSLKLYAALVDGRSRSLPQTTAASAEQEPASFAASMEGQQLVQ